MGNPIYGKPRDPKAKEDKTDVASPDAIKSAIAQEKDSHWRLGLRRMDRPPPIGSELAPSRVFNRNVPTRQRLPGTSALPLNKGGTDVDRQLSVLRSQYGGSHVVLLGSERDHEGADTGEVVLERAKVLRIWRM
jgi:hypothetical protein